MKRLILMRHAKSGWDDLALTDHARTLSERGQHSADAVGHWLQRKSLIPDHILCSDAARTQETLSGLNLGEIGKTITRTLYLADPDVMVRMLHTRDEDCILMVAHNPGTATLAQMLLAQAPAHPEFDGYPTCATLVADFNIPSWRDIRNESGQLVAFIVPRDLIE